MRYLKLLSIFFCAFMIFGCVSSGTYKACLSDVDALKGDKAKLEDLLKTKDAQLDALRAQKSKLEVDIANKDKQNNLLKEKINNLEKDIKNKETEKKTLEEKNAKLEKDYNELVTENSDLRKTLSSSKDELTKNVSELQTKLKERESRVSLLEEDVLTKSGQIATLKDEIRKNKEQITSLEASIKEKEEQKSALEKQLLEKDEQIKKMGKDLASKDIMINDLKNEIKALSTDRAKVLEEKERAIAELKKTHDKLIVELSEEIKKGETEVTLLRDKLTLQMVEKILFDSGSAEIKGSGKKVLERVAEILKKVTDRQIRIEGHTDNKPIGAKIAKKFPTNWELSTARATNVVRYLKEKGGIDPRYLSAAGYAEYKPVDTNDTEEGRAKNRRIEIVLIPIELETTKVMTTK